jgi:hypothetical protein
MEEAPIVAKGGPPELRDGRFGWQTAFASFGQLMGPPRRV